MFQVRISAFIETSMNRPASNELFSEGFPPHADRNSIQQNGSIARTLPSQIAAR